MKKYDYSCLIEGTQDAEPVEGFRPQPGAIQITKAANSAFVGTNLEQALEAVGATELVLTGVSSMGAGAWRPPMPLNAATR